ncbi:MAG: ABC transporter permease [Oscillospiraceae bacterium]|jgi:oligopeptide transport system permease protein|nr:ABC transporter permease [Oscillospiraceae bacterium]
MTPNELKALDINTARLSFRENEVSRFDLELTTKPKSFAAESFIRFCKNKSSVVGAIIIIALIFASIVGPLFVPYELSYNDNDYINMKPKGFIFGDGTYTLDGDAKTFLYWSAIGLAIKDTNGDAFKNGELSVSNDDDIINELSPIRSYVTYSAPDGSTRYKMKIDSYFRMGFKIVTLSQADYDALLAYQVETGEQVVYPMLPKPNQRSMNIWFAADSKNMPKLDKNGNLTEEYLRDGDGNVMFFYPSGNNGSQKLVRVLTYKYYVYKNGHVPVNILGTNNIGQDVFVRICGGVRTSLLLALAVFVVTFVLGAFIGAIEGFFGGWLDMLIERIKDVISGIPFVVLATLFQLTFVVTGKVSGVGSLLFAFVLTGWISNSSLLRTQFYRFKKQEYVLAAQTLGASDMRQIFKHIFPNSLGTVVTMCALDIPYTIVSEASLSYLGLVSLETTNTSSLGNMLSNGQGNLLSNPHLLLVPAIVLALLMICFNLFGNGLRDALNPTLRGSED